MLNNTPTEIEALVERLQGLLANGVIPSDSGWYVSGYTSDGLATISDGLRHGIFPFRCEGHQAALIVEAVNALPKLLAALSSRPSREADILNEIRDVALRDIARTSTDFLGRMGQALCEYQAVFDDAGLNELTPDQCQEAEDAITWLLGLALAQLAMLRSPTAPAEALLPPTCNAPSSREAVLREALEPFVGFAPHKNEDGNLKVLIGCTVADIRRARAALQPDAIALGEKEEG